MPEHEFLTNARQISGEDQMSYRFKGKESVGRAVERIALEQLEEALKHTKARTSLDEAIHDVRICFKKLRGLIRLVRDELGDNRYRSENKCYRDVNRELSGVRDSAALTEIFSKVKERFSDELNEVAFESFRRLLSRSAKGRPADKRRALVEVRKKILAARKRVKQWKLGDDRFPAVGKGLTRMYGRGRKGFAAAFDNETVSAFHEWRKDVKYFWYQIELLRELWPGHLKDLADEIKDLVDDLSDDHDLALLRKRALSAAKKEKDGHEYEALLALVDKRRAELETRACFLGQRIYAEGPNAFESRIHHYWRAWRAEEKSNPLAAT